jgi:hypothetical protein
MAQRKYRPGTRIEIKGFSLSNEVVWRPAKIGAVRRCMLPLPDGYLPVTYPDGARLLAHESIIRVTDNRVSA